ncbi:MAG TPA: 50S ribosomal protein L4 [Tepidisphaeraceae bacterium]|jgi:large subunit ribosomal protein L4
MIEVPVYNLDGGQVGTVQVDEAKLGGEVNNKLLKQAIVYYHANKRQGSVRTLARGEVAGSTRKLFKQKGTGNARTGGIRNPIKVGGGHAKQKRPKSWRQSLNKKTRVAARNQAILAKIQSSQLKLVDAFTLTEPKTKLFAAALKKLQIERTVLVGFDAMNDVSVKAARNIPNTRLTTVAQLNAWDILNTRTLLLTRDGLQSILNVSEAVSEAKD